MGNNVLIPKVPVFFNFAPGEDYSMRFDTIDDIIANQKEMAAELKALRKMLEQLGNKQVAPAKRGPGRPRKDREPAQEK